MSSEKPPRAAELPADIAARLDDLIQRFGSDLRREIARMFRYANMTEVDATKALLSEQGTPLTLTEIIEHLKAGGIWRPSTEAYGSSADVEMRRSIARAAAHGVNIRYIDREKELIGLVDQHPAPEPSSQGGNS